MSRKNSIIDLPETEKVVFLDICMLAEHEKSFVTSGPGFKSL